jgi:hypothetical protein
MLPIGLDPSHPQLTSSQHKQTKDLQTRFHKPRPQTPDPRPNTSNITFTLREQIERITEEKREQIAQVTVEKREQIVWIMEEKRKQIVWIMGGEA